MRFFSRLSQANHLFCLFVSLFEDETGQSTVEYILILSAVMTGAIALARTLLGVLNTGILRLGGQLEKDLKTGRAPLSDWKY